jgi:hypothetical protein
MSPGFKTRESFLRLAGGTRRNKRPPAALPPSLRTRLSASRMLASPTRSIDARLHLNSAAPFVPPACPERSERASCRRLCLSPVGALLVEDPGCFFGTAPSSRTACAPSLTSSFLIGTPRLEFPATPTKQTPDSISNRDRSAYFYSRNPTQQIGFLTSPPQLRLAHLERFCGPHITRHLSPITCFLIANPRLEFRLTPFKNTHLKISNREYIAVFQIVSSPWISRSSNIRTRQFNSARELEA